MERWADVGDGCGKETGYVSSCTIFGVVLYGLYIAEKEYSAFYYCAKQSVQLDWK
jgi:hypothetical protein